MRFQVIIAVTGLLTLGACGRPVGSFDSSGINIVNGYVPGRSVQDQRVQSTVSITDSRHAQQGYSFCTGTLLTPRLVMTAAHCIDAGDYLVGFGTTVANSVFRPVVRKVAYSGYSKYPVPSGDIALLFLGADAPTTHQAASVFTGSFRGGESLVVAGFGVTYSGASASDTGILRYAQVALVEESSRNTSELILQGRRGEDTCQGDSGGPAYLPTGNGYAVVGVTSWGRGCGGPGHYTDVRSYIDWIVQTYKRYR